jgi:RND superfamily putative drug exporter
VSASARERAPTQAQFARLGRFAIRFRWLIVAGWIGLVVLGTVTLPSLSSNSKANNAQFLSSSSPSVEAAKLAAPFQGKSASLTAILIAARASGPLTAADLAAVGRAEHAAQQVPGVALVRDEGVSRDGTAAQALVTVTPAASNSAGASKAVVDAVRASFTRVGAPPGLGLHLTGQLAISVDSSNTHSGAIAMFTLLFVVVLLFVVYRAALAPLITLVPAVLSFVLAGRLVGAAAKAGLSMPSVSQQLLIVLLLGAGTDYGLFLSSRVREELTRGAEPRAAVVAAMGPIGEAIAYSAATVIAALLTLLLATFAIYRGLGPALAIGIAVLLAATLTLTPALLAIFGRAAFWPSHPRPGHQRPGAWGQVAERVVKHPRRTLAAGVALLAALALGLVGYRTAPITSNAAPAGSDSAAGQQLLAAHFPKATVGGDQLLLRYPNPVWQHPATLAAAQQQLDAAPVLRSITGPLGPSAGRLSPTTLAGLHQTLGPAGTLPQSPPPSSNIAPSLYRPYRQTAQFISPDGRTIQYYAVLSAGAVGSTPAADQIPQAQTALNSVARTTGASASGVAGQDASAHDINTASTSSLELVVPIVLVVIFVLLALLLRSLIAPWYLTLTVALSYLASLGFAMLVFVHLGPNSGLIFVLPLLMFVFSMALGEDYNILIMSRIREETGKHASFRQAVAHAMAITGTTVTSAGIILAGTFAVLGIAGGSSEAQQLGFSIAFGVLLDTFFVRTLLIPSIAVLLGRWNWWPSHLSHQPKQPPRPAGPPLNPSPARSANQRMSDRTPALAIPRRFRTPKAYLGWAFALLVPVALSSGALGNELRVLGLAITGSVSVDLLLALALGLTAERLGPHGLERSRKPPWRGLLARRRPPKPFWPSGALLAGAIIGLLLDPSSPPWVAFAAGALASVSKHTIRYRARHIFNPAAFGLLAGSLLFSEQISWWGALPALPLTASILMILAGAIVLDRSRKLPSAIAFLTTYYGIYLTVAITDPHHATEAFRSPISNAIFFFALFMLSDPPTAPTTIRAQLTYGALIAAIGATLELTSHSQTFLLVALCAGNLYAAASRARRTRHRRGIPRSQECRMNPSP